MPDYGKTTDHLEIKSGSLFLFKSGSLTDPTTAISASVPQIVAITCSSNFNNRLSKLNQLNSYGIITVTSGSSNTVKDTKLVLRYYSGSKTSNILFSSSQDSLDHVLGGIDTSINYIDIPLNNNDDSYIVALKTLRALTASVGYNIQYSASWVDDGSNTNLSSSLGKNMIIGSSFKIRNSASSNGNEGKILIHSINSNEEFYHSSKRRDHYKTGKVTNDYQEKFHKNFTEEISIPDKYNRFIAFSAEHPHSSNNFNPVGNPRLFLIGFVEEISKANLPILRMNQTLLQDS